MFNIKDKLGLAISLVVASLQTVDQTAELNKWHQNNDYIRASVTSGSGKTSMNIVALTVETDKKCLISLYVAEEDRCLGQSIFQYEPDLEIDSKQNFPVAFEQYKEQNKERLGAILTRITDKLSISVSSCYKQKQDEIGEATENVSKDIKHMLQEREPIQGSSLSSTASFKQPADMPDFDDEYEIHDHRTPQGLQERLPQRYGDTDLYPTGEKYPNLMDPTSSMPLPAIPGQGGMFFDPMQEQSRRRQEQERKSRGPGFLPGAKFDDPYGPPSSFGTGPPGFDGSNSFGGRGFI